MQRLLTGCHTLPVDGGATRVRPGAKCSSGVALCVEAAWKERCAWGMSAHLQDPQVPFSLIMQRAAAMQQFRWQPNLVHVRVADLV